MVILEIKHSNIDGQGEPPRFAKRPRNGGVVG
jgi:hypothetical protein